MELISNWRVAYKMFSMQALAFIAFAQGVLAAVPPAYLATPLPFTTTSYGQLLVAMTIIAAVLGGLGRLIDQKALPPE